MVCDNGGFAVINRLQVNTGGAEFNNLLRDDPPRALPPGRLRQARRVDGRDRRACRERRRPAGRVRPCQGGRSELRDRRSRSTSTPGPRAAPGGRSASPRSASEQQVRAAREAWDDEQAATSASASDAGGRLRWPGRHRHRRGVVLGEAHRSDPHRGGRQRRPGRPRRRTRRGRGRSPRRRRPGSSQTDVSRDADLDRLIATALEDHGRLDGVVGATANFEDERLASTRELWDRVLDTNVASAAMLTTKAAAVMTAGGAIVHVASISGHVSQPARVVYNVSKAALLMLVKSAAHHLASRSIRVNAVSPGWMWSRNIERRYGTRERADALAAEFQPLGRMADPEEVAHAIAFLLSEPRLVRDGRRAARRRRLLDDRPRGARPTVREGPDDRVAPPASAGRAFADPVVELRPTRGRGTAARRARSAGDRTVATVSIQVRAPSMIGPDHSCVLDSRTRACRGPRGRPASCGRPCSWQIPSGSARGS